MSSDRSFELTAPKSSRRTAIAVLGSAALSACADGVNQGDAATEAGVLIDAGHITGLPVGTFQAVQNVIVGRDDRGAFAYTRVCTHQSCTVPAPTGVPGISTCPCHGSRYDGTGAVVGGPATRPLAHHPVSIVDGRILVDASRLLPDASARTPVPG